MSNGTEIPGGEAQPAVPAGWYPHPTAPGWEAYWNGVAWGTETRPAQVAAATPSAEVAAEPAAQAAATAEQQPVQPAPATAAEQQPAQAATPAATAGAAAGGVAAAPAAAARATARSDSSLAAVLCILGAIVAIVGTFLPMGSSDVVDLADNTMVAQTYGLAVIALAAVGAIIAAYAYSRALRTWLLVLLGAVIVAIAAYAGLVGVDDLEAAGLPNLPSLDGAGGQTPDPKALEAIAEAAQSDAGEPSPSTGIFVTGAGGILMLLGGLGLTREPR